MLRNKELRTRGTIAWGAIAVIALSMCSAAETAESSPATESDDAVIDTVTVERMRQRELLERQVGTFVSSITLPNREESLARWQEPVCPLVAGLSLEQGTFVFERIVQVAKQAGVLLAPNDCRPNLVVVMTREPEALLKRWWSRNRSVFNTDRGVAGIKHTIRTPAPVRVIYNACSVPSGLPNMSARSVVGLCGLSGVPGSRLRWSVVRVLYSVIVVVDKEQTGHLELGALTDYIAMISLAQIRRDPDLDTAPTTILRLFDESNAQPPQELSGWDRAFLKSLYATDPGLVTQKSAMKRLMTVALEPTAVDE